GRFSLTSDAAFTSLVVTSIGYARSVVTVSDASQALTIELTPAPVLQPGVEVTGKTVDEDRLKVSQATGTLTHQDLNRGNGLELENSINTLPGVMMQSRTMWGGAHIQIRGYYPNFSQNSNGLGTTQFLNEVPVTDASGLTIVDDVDFSSLGRVDVV